jgi:hypothetical protein
LLGALLLARLEGDSPVEYLNDLDIPAVKKVAISLLEKISGPVINTVQVILENAK